LLAVTEAALERLSHELRSKKAADDVAMRFTRGVGGGRLRPSHTGPDHTAFTHEGRNVLLWDEVAPSQLAIMKLDVEASKVDAGLKLR